jgi:O-antigen ligase
MWTLYKSLEYLIDVALIAAVVASVRTVKEVKSLFDWTWVLWSCLALTVCLGVAVWPEQAIVHQGLLGLQIRGILPAIETNGVGDVAAILSIVALTRLLFPTEYKRFYLVVLLVSMVMLIFSQSRSPLTGFLVAVALVLFAAKRIRTVTLLCLIIPVVLSFTSLGNLFSEFFQRGQSSKYFDSLSGRVPLWESGWELFNEQPLTGYGAYAAGRFGVIGNLRNTNWSSILNTWLEVLIGTGLIGVMPLLGAFLGMWVMLLRSPPSGTDACSVLQRLRIEGIGVLAILSVRSMFTVEFIWHPPLTFLLVLGYAEMLHRAYRENSYESNYSSATIRRRAVSVQS